MHILERYFSRLYEGGVVFQVKTLKHGSCCLDKRPVICRGGSERQSLCPCSVCYRETYTVLKMCSFRWVLVQPRLRRASIDSLARASPRSSYKKEGIGSRSYNTYYFPLSTLPLFFLLLLLSLSLSSRFIYPTYTVKFTNSIDKMPFSLSCSWE